MTRSCKSLLLVLATLCAVIALAASTATWAKAISQVSTSGRSSVTFAILQHGH
jgi:hypothetical protein